MYDVEVYESSSGNIPIKDFLESFSHLDERKLAAIKHYIEMLKEYGPEINIKFKKGSSKKIQKDLYELRPNNNRVLFFYYTSNTIVLLHGFVKKTNKTPKKQIEKAINEIKDYRKRHK
jgi:phage-related protein